MTTRVQLTEDRVRIGVARDGGRARKEVYYDEIVTTEARPFRGGGRGSSVVLHLRDGARDIVLELDADERERIADELWAIIAGWKVALETVSSVADVTAATDRIGSRAGFVATAFVEFLLLSAARLGASDVHVAPGAEQVVIRLRVNGTLHAIGALSVVRGRRVIARLKVLAGLKAHRTDIPQEGRISIDGSSGGEEFRLSCVPALNGERIAVRAYDRLKGSLSPEALGLDPEALATLRRACRAPQGVVVLCGPSASGKTTTAYALLRELARERGDTASLVTIEDPVEFDLAGVDQLEIAPGRGSSAEQLLRSVLRQDVDVIMLGEIRAPETAEVAFAAGTSGHLVITTLHAGSAAEAIVRLRELGVEPFVLSTALTAVASQRLIRTVDDNGRYAGREALAEVLLMDDSVRAALETQPSAHEIERIAIERGMVPLAEVASQKLAAGVTDLAEIERVIG